MSVVSAMPRARSTKQDRQTDRQVCVHGQCQRVCADTGVQGLCSAPSPWAQPWAELWSTDRVSCGQQHSEQQWGIGVSTALCSLLAAVPWFHSLCVSRFQFVLLNSSTWLHWPCSNYWKHQLKLLVASFIYVNAKNKCRLGLTEYVDLLEIFQDSVFILFFYAGTSSWKND